MSETRLHHLLGDEPAHADDQQGGGTGEEDVAQGVDHVIGVEQLGRRLGKPLQQGITARGEEVGGKATGDPGKGRGYPGQRVAPGGVEDDATYGDDQHITRIGRRVADDGHQDQHGGQETGGGDFQQLLQAGVDEAGLLGHPDPQHGHQHYAERGEAGEGRDHAGEELGQASPGQQVVDHDGLPGTGIDQIKGELGEDPGTDPDDQQGIEEQHGGIRQFVACLLDPVQEAVQPAVGRAGRTLVHCGLTHYGDTPLPRNERAS
ncbi:hypothetical protein D3C84_356560 [compost metagenome]